MKQAINDKQRKCDLSGLLHDTPESLYWLGFLMADGNFRAGRIRVTVAKKDADHLRRLQQFLHIQNSSVAIIKGAEYVSIGGMHKEVVEQLVERFSIHTNKTKNPCDLSGLKEEELFCLAAGFIDGDGRIAKVHDRPHAFLSVKCHASWKANLEKMLPDAFTAIDARGYALARITDSEVLHKLKARAVGLNLPLLARKWDAIDLSFVSREQRTKENIPLIVEMLANNCTRKQICATLGYSYSALSNLITRKGLANG